MCVCAYTSIFEQQTKRQAVWYEDEYPIANSHIVYIL